MWNAIEFITSGLTLVGFLAALAAWMYSRKLQEKERLIATASEAQRADLVASALEFFKIDSALLPKEQQFELAVQQIAARARRFTLAAIVVVTLSVVFAILAGFAIANFSRQAASSTQSSLPAFDASELAGEYYAQLGPPQKNENAAKQLKSEFDELVDELASSNKQVDDGVWSYNVGLFFGKSDVCVEKSLENPGEWIVGIDLVKHVPEGESEMAAREKLNAINDRLAFYLSPRTYGKVPLSARGKELLDRLQPIISDAVLREYSIAQYLRVYGRELQNTRHLH